MAIVLMVFGAALVVGGLAAIIGGAPFFALGVDNSLVLTGTVATTGGVIAVGLGFLLQLVMRLEARLASAGQSLPVAPPAPVPVRPMPVGEPAPVAVAPAPAEPPRRQAPAAPAPPPVPLPTAVVTPEPPFRPEEVPPSRPPPPEVPRMQPVPPPRPVPPPQPVPPAVAPAPVAGPVAVAPVPTAAAAPEPADPFRSAWQKVWGREWADRNAPPPPPEPPPVAAPPVPPATDARSQVIKAGVIGGMAYTLYADGSIEAELPEGLVRFPTIQALRDHVEQAEAAVGRAASTG